MSTVHLVHSFICRYGKSKKKSVNSHHNSLLPMNCETNMMERIFHVKALSRLRPQLGFKSISWHRRARDRRVYFTWCWYCRACCCFFVSAWCRICRTQHALHDIHCERCFPLENATNLSLLLLDRERKANEWEKKKQ